MTRTESESFHLKVKVCGSLEILIIAISGDVIKWM